jgi:geranylgeranyl diphosphate synthase type II
MAGPSARGSAGVHAAYIGVLAVLVALLAVLVALLVVVLGRAKRAHRALTEVHTALGGAAEQLAVVRRPEPLRELAAEQLVRPRTRAGYKAEIDALILRAAQLGEFGQVARLAEACGQALRGGKRLRAIALMEVARATSAALRSAAQRGGRRPPEPADPADAALAIEYLHAASLVVDDLPAFDNDAERRGSPALHIAFGEAEAQMAALSLLMLAGQALSRQTEWLLRHSPTLQGSERVGLRLANELYEAVGLRGAAAGQFLDACGADVRELGQAAGPDGVTELLRLKTGALFGYAFLAGWVVAGGAMDEPAEELQLAGVHFGIAFQVADDLGDLVQDAQRAEAGKVVWNFAHQFGEGVAHRAVAEHLRVSGLLLEAHEVFTPLWAELFEMVRTQAARD